MHRLIATAFLLAAFTVPARGAFVVDVNQVGSNVVFVGSGSLNISGLIVLSNTITAAVTGSDPSTALGVAGFVPASLSFVAYTGPANFGTGPFTLATSGLGDRVGFVLGDLNALIYPTGYVSGSALSSSSTYANTTIAGLGLDVGNYVFRYSARGSSTVLDTITVRINAQSVPEPTSVAMLGVGLASIAIARRRGLRLDVA